MGFHDKKPNFSEKGFQAVKRNFSHALSNLKMTVEKAINLLRRFFAAIF